MRGYTDEKKLYAHDLSQLLQSQLFQLGVTENYYKNQSQFFIRLLASFLAGWPSFCLSHTGLKGLTIGLAIDEAVLRVEEVIVDLFGWFLWNELIIFLRC